MIADARFEPSPPLPDWLDVQLPFARRVFLHDGHRVHFVDEGVGRPILLQHGNPMWCYLWRKVIPQLLETGFRVIAPDLVGFGLSDKPRSLATHSLEFHGRMIGALVDALGLSDLGICGQDWGGPVAGLVAANAPERVTSAVFANTSISAPKKAPRQTAFHKLANRPIVSDVLFRGLGFPLSVLHRVQGDPGSIGRNERRAYRYPLRRLRDRAAPLALARMVPLTLAHPSLPALERIESWARAFRGPVELVWGLKDPILGPALGRVRDVFPDAPLTETQAGHFLQEEVPDVLAAAIGRVAAAAGAA